jgi:hypothetical protein
VAVGTKERCGREKEEEGRGAKRMAGQGANVQDEAGVAL